MVGQLLLPSVALAADWINVGGTQYDGGAAVSDKAGTWSWNGADDMQLNGYNGGGISAEGNLNIGVTNTNTVTADAGQSAIEMLRRQPFHHGRRHTRCDGPDRCHHGRG